MKKKIIYFSKYQVINSEIQFDLSQNIHRGGNLNNRVKINLNNCIQK
jgi:hypothetical protein